MSTPLPSAKQHLPRNSRLLGPPTWPGLPWPSRSHRDLDATVTCGGHPLLTKSGHFPQGTQQQKCSEPASPNQEPRWTLKILPAYLPTAMAKAKMKAGLQPDQDLVRQGHLPLLESLLPLMAEALGSAKPLFLWRKPAADVRLLPPILGAAPLPLSSGSLDLVSTDTIFPPVLLQWHFLGQWVRCHPHTSVCPSPPLEPWSPQT